jgi:hypothetical protein
MLGIPNHDRLFLCASITLQRNQTVVWRVRLELFTLEN